MAVIGASVSGGFVDFLTPAPGAEPNSTISVAVACRSVWPRERVDVRNYSDVATFFSPAKKAGRAVEKARRAQPDLVVGVDFMFWFGYGRPGLVEEGGRLRRGGGPERLLKQQRAFELLEQLECPIIIGDYPEITDADPRIFPRSVIPDADTLQELNRRLRAWAAERPRVHVVDLAEWVRRVKAGEEIVEVGEASHRLPASAVLQTDGLHASRLGVAILVHRILPVVRQALPAGHPLTVDWPTLGEHLERTGADVELPPATEGRGRSDG